MTRPIYIPLGGGLDLITPTRQLNPGAALSAINYECPVTGGYRRIDGYTQWGDLVPGDGPILGVAVFDDDTYAVRKDAGVNSATLYRLDGSTWTAVGTGGELDNNRYEFDEGNAYATEAGNALYGVGGGKPFELKQDGTLSTLTNAPSGATMIALHQNHLFLGFDAGSLQFSGIGDPTNWDAATGGAGEIGVGQTLTGIVKGVGGVLHVMCRDSIQTLRFRSAEESQLEVTIPGVGVRRYSAQTMTAQFFVSERGISNLQAADQFGDFSLKQPGRVVEPLFIAGGYSDRVVASAVSRSKAQYRVFFDDGSGFYFSPTGITQVQFPHQVSAACSGELSSGNEMSLFGSDSGYVYRLDHGNDFAGTPVRALLTLAFTDLKAPSARKRFRRAFWDIRAGSESRMWLQPDFDYGDTQTGRPRRTPIDYMLGGGLWGVDNWGSFNWSVPVIGQEPVDIEGTGTSINFAIFSESSDEPHEILGYDLHAQTRRLRRG